MGRINVVLVEGVLCEDGHCLAQHCSSHEYFVKHDIGFTSEWKHEHYKEHCKEGYELIWIEDASNSHEIDAAYIKNQELANEASKTYV